MRVSICMPCYNRGSYIAGAIKSCLNQTHKDIELVLVDDASSDNSLKVMSKYVKDPRVVLVRNKKRRGIPASFNKAIRSSSGDAIVINGSDDYYTPNSVQARVEALEHSGVDVVCGKIKSFYGKHDYKWCVQHHDKLKSHTDRIAGHAVMMRRRVFERYGLFYENMSVSSDKEMWERHAIAGVLWKHIDDACAYVRLHKGSTAHNTKKSRRQLDKKAYRSRIAELNRDGITKENTIFL